MKKIPSYLWKAVLVLVLIASCGPKVKLIPKDKLALIHMDMLMADQWLKIAGNRQKVDTFQLYAPIFTKYGYDTEDYRHTVEYYLDSPEEFSKIFDKTTELLRARFDSVGNVLRARNKADSTMRALLAMDIRRPVLYKDFFKEPYASDTISFELDSNGIYQIQRIIRDTMFKGPLLVIKEEPVADSLQTAKDSLAKAGLDTLKAFEKPKRIVRENRISRNLTPIEREENL